jgi:integral membrane protein
MEEILKTKLGWLRITAFLEGVSFLLLLGIAMPLKYIWGMPEWVRAVGMAHGWLFIAYVCLVAYMRSEEDWSFRKTALALIASVIPFGTFWADARLFRRG